MEDIIICLKYDEGIIGINNRNLENFTVSLDNTVKIFKEFGFFSTSQGVEFFIFRSKIIYKKISINELN